MQFSLALWMLLDFRQHGQRPLQSFMGIAIPLFNKRREQDDVFIGVKDKNNAKQNPNPFPVFVKTYIPLKCEMLHMRFCSIAGEDGQTADPFPDFLLHLYGKFFIKRKERHMAVLFAVNIYPIHIYLPLLLSIRTFIMPVYRTRNTISERSPKWCQSAPLSCP